MFRRLFEQYMRTEPETVDQKYIFIVDNSDLALSIADAGFQTVALEEEKTNLFTLDSFCSYLAGLELKGTCMTDYMYVPACQTKKSNERLIECFRELHLLFREGWMLFKDQECYKKLGYRKEIQGKLRSFIDSYEKPPNEEADKNCFHQVNKDGEATSPLDIAIVEHLLKGVPFIVLEGNPYVYVNGVYLQDKNGNLLKEKIRDCLYRKFMRSGTINRIYELLISMPEVQRVFGDVYNLPGHWVNFRNGFYDPAAKMMIPHDPKYLCFNQISFDFDPAKKEGVVADNSAGKVTRSYLAESLPDREDQKMFWQYAGYCMCTDTSQQKMLILTGNGGTGKSVLIDLIQELVGIRNCCSVSLQDLNKRFYATNLFGKLLNACGDIPVGIIDKTDVVKKAVGEDVLLFEKKGKDPSTFRSHAKLLFSCNSVPKNVEDKSDAFYRRLLILEMDHVIPAAEKDIHLKDKIRSEREYAVYRAVQGLEELCQNGQIEESANSIASVRKARIAADSVFAFLNEMICRKEGSRIDRSRMYQLYEDYCRDNDRTAVKKTNFFADMERKGYFTSKYQGVFKYKDVVLKSEVEADEPKQISRQMKLDGFEPVRKGAVIPFEAV
ncbi:phage/plasmid primase, P4 family, C-terminal domain-containing protein [Sarcina sp. DSM 11001]|uniref:DNA primase family protein n=1 Tax=Sarcina sp. DSM 11001 TaxID=1798184 RepID=UPI0008868250|nr:DNA primase family protein [Sarcina sp. DSM 11001]SDK45100.1 phage/plasmid primase, P4 family, C-terminal domain-containing protein [Sarcina sp. DSM 11001]